MILLWLFEFIDGSTYEGKFKGNWLSFKWHQYQNLKRSNIQKKWMKHAQSNVIYFEVPGAGEISLDKHPISRCGEAVGFSFGVSWGTHGFCGGVIGRSEAKRMASFILDTCEKYDAIETEEQIILRHKNE